MDCTFPRRSSARGASAIANDDSEPLIGEPLGVEMCVAIERPAACGPP